MNSLPSSFSSNPDMEPRKYFKNLLISFRKEIEGAKNLDTLQDLMQAILNAAKDLKYKHTNHTATFHKDNAEKAFKKIWNEFDRFFILLSKKDTSANPQDLLDSISIVESMIKEGDVS